LWESRNLFYFSLVAKLANDNPKNCKQTIFKCAHFCVSEEGM